MTPANGQRRQIQEFDSQSTSTNNVASNPVRTTNYTYDGVNRLTQEALVDRSGNTTVTTYQYDKVGNRSQKATTTQAGTETIVYSYDSNDRLMQETDSIGAAQTITTYAWDVNGNLQSKTIGSQTTFYFWDSRNGLIEVDRGADRTTATAIAKYTYDPVGNRVLKSEPQTDKTTAYLIDNSFEYAQSIREIAVQGTSVSKTDLTWGDGLVSIKSDGQLNFVHLDGSGSTKALSDSDGSIANTYAFDAFGNKIAIYGNSANPYQYTGEYYDDSINLQYNRARFYSSKLGQFISADQLSGSTAIPITLNRYLYAGGDPVNSADPSGMEDLVSQESAMSIVNDLIVDQIKTSIGDAFFGDPDSVGPNQPQTLYEVLVATTIGVVAQSFMQYAGVGSGILSGNSGGGGSGSDKHHTIPLYMCGAANQELVSLSNPAHKLLHSTLYKFELGVRIASKTFDLIFKKKRIFTARAPIADVARTPTGRIAIAVGLALFYENFEYRGTPYAYLGSGLQSKLPLGFVLAKEAAMFSGVKHNYPACKR